MRKQIMTVRGPVDARELGFTLPHEHVMVDFIGARETGKHRYDPDDVVKVILPHLREIRNLGVSGFVDCTPMYLGRDPLVLKRLSELTGLYILTNTGQYKEPYLPEKTFSVSVEELAESWIREFQDGIEETGIMPGFVKTAVDPGPMKPTERKVLEAAALVSRQTGLTVATHTGDGKKALEILNIMEDRGADPNKWIFVHAQSETDERLLKEAAVRGAWIELDGIGPETEEVHLRMLLILLDAGFEEQLLLSHDAGWYNIGEESGGSQRPFTHLPDVFLPLLRKQGISEKLIQTLTETNPQRAFSLS